MTAQSNARSSPCSEDTGFLSTERTFCWGLWTTPVSGSICGKSRSMGPLDPEHKLTSRHLFVAYKISKLRRIFAVIVLVFDLGIYLVIEGAA